MIVTHKLSPMDLTCRGVTQRIDVVQDDRYSRNLEFTLTQNGEAWTIPTAAAAVVRFKKSDGTGGNYDTLPDGSLAYSFSGNVLTVALAPQVCTAPGLVLLAVGLLYGDAEINTFTVHIVVQPNPGIDVVSEDYSHIAGYVKSAGWTPNMFLGTDADGNVVAVGAGADGRGVVSIRRTAGNGAQGTTDTYTITYTDGTTDALTVYNGKDGAAGVQGPQGTAGADGYTPVKGVDYYTDADKTELVNAVLAALPAAEEVSV